MLYFRGVVSCHFVFMSIRVVSKMTYFLIRVKKMTCFIIRIQLGCFRVTTCNNQFVFRLGGSYQVDGSTRLRLQVKSCHFRVRRVNPKMTCLVFLLSGRIRVSCPKYSTHYLLIQCCVHVMSKFPHLLYSIPTRTVSSFMLGYHQVMDIQHCDVFLGAEKHSTGELMGIA